jgi:hypothetical protein
MISVGDGGVSCSSGGAEGMGELCCGLFLYIYVFCRVGFGEVRGLCLVVVVMGRRQV